MPKKKQSGAAAKGTRRLPPFELKECSILISPTGQKAANLAQLASALHNVEDQVIYHHVYRCFLKHTFQQSRFPNDFAIWAAQALNDFVLAEKLANLDPYGECGRLDEVRAYLTDAVDSHLASKIYVPVAKPGFDFFFERSVLQVSDTGLVARSIPELAENLREVQVSSLYYHFFDGRRRLGSNIDDFRHWLNDSPEHADLVRRIDELDFFLMDLEDLRMRLIEVLEQGAAK